MYFIRVIRLVRANRVSGCRMVGISVSVSIRLPCHEVQKHIGALTSAALLLAARLAGAKSLIEKAGADDTDYTD